MVAMRGDDGNLTAASSDTLCSSFNFMWVDTGIADMEGKTKSLVSLGDYLLLEKDLESQRRSAARQPGVSSGNLSRSTDDGGVSPQRSREMVMCFEKDICIDEGANVSKCCDEKDLEITTDDDRRKKQVYVTDHDDGDGDGDGDSDGDGKIPRPDSRSSLTKGKEFESEVILCDGGDVDVREEDVRNLFQENPKTSPDNYSSSSFSSSDNVDDNNNNLKPAAELESNASKPDLAGHVEQDGIVQQDPTAQNTTVTTTEVVHQTSSIVHHIPPQSVMIEGPQYLSDRIIPGQPEYSGSISIRSESSNTSARSFAFPILHSEGHLSPVKMAKAGRRRRYWNIRHRLCCRF